jgi:hypothetical protein
MDGLLPPTEAIAARGLGGPAAKRGHSYRSEWTQFDQSTWPAFDQMAVSTPGSAIGFSTPRVGLDVAPHPGARDRTRSHQGAVMPHAAKDPMISWKSA